jgi:hypothetical protein
MIAKSARRAGAALCIHVPPAGFLGRAECGARKHHMAIGMLDHTAGIATACGAEPVVITSSTTRRAARATYSPVLTYISNPVVFVLEAASSSRSPSTRCSASGASCTISTQPLRHVLA